MVFDAPRQARAFFEALVADNLDVGRPDSVELIFTGHKGRRGRLPKVEQVYKTKVVTCDTAVTVNAFYKHSRVKQYLKDGRALRIETVVNSPTDLRCLRRLQNLNELAAKGRDVNARMLNTERVEQSCVIASPAFERVALPRSPRTGAGPQPYGSATLVSWLCSAPYVSPWAPSGSPTGAFEPTRTACSARPTTPTR